MAHCRNGSALRLSRTPRSFLYHSIAKFQLVEKHISWSRAQNCSSGDSRGYPHNFYLIRHNARAVDEYGDPRIDQGGPFGFVMAEAIERDLGVMLYLSMIKNYLQYKQTRKSNNYLGPVLFLSNVLSWNCIW